MDERNIGHIAASENNVEIISFLKSTVHFDFSQMDRYVILNVQFINLIFLNFVKDGVEHLMMMQKSLNLNKYAI